MTTIPPDWQWRRIGDIAELHRGVSYRKADASQLDGAGRVPIVRATNISDRLTFEDLVYVPPRYVRPEQMLKSGDIVVATSSGSRSVVGKAAMLEADWVGSFGAFCMVIRPRGGIVPRYLGYYLQTQAYREAISGLAAGIGIHNLRRAHLANLPVPIAPLAKQEAVVATIEQQLTRVEAAFGALHAARARFSRYLDVSLRMVLSGSSTRSLDDERGDENGRSLRAKALEQRKRSWFESNQKTAYRQPSPPLDGALGKLPAGWAMATLEEITDPVRTVSYGILMPKDDLPEGVPYVRVKDIQGDRIAMDGLRRTSPEIAAKYQRSRLQAGDLLIAIRGSYGRVAEVPDGLEGGNITQDTARISVSAPIRGRYVAAYLRGPIAQGHLRHVARGVAVKGVNIGDLRALPIPLPPIPEQESIADEVDREVSSVRVLDEEVRLAIRRAHVLRRVILREAFAGRLGSS